MNTYRWHNLHHTHIPTARLTQLHAHNLSKGRDTRLGRAVRRVERQREVRQRGASEKEVRLGARPRQSEQVRSEGLCDEARRDEVGRDLADHLLAVRRLEDRVVVLDAGVEEDGVEVGEIGQDARDVALQVGEVGHVPLWMRKGDCYLSVGGFLHFFPAHE